MNERKRGPGRPGRDLADLPSEDIDSESPDDSETVLDADGFSADGGGRRRRGVPSERDEGDLPDEPPPGYFD